MIKIHQVYQYKKVPKYGDDYSPARYETVLIEQYADRTAADKKRNELKETSDDYCFVNELSIPIEVVEQALKNITSQQV